HDDFRGVSGSFQRTLDAMATSADVGLEFQVNTTVTRRTIADLPRIADILTDSGAVLWDLFFLVPMGRAQSEEVISAEDHERVFNWLCDLSSGAPFQVKTTLGMHYRRVQLQRRLAEQGQRSDELTSQQVQKLYRGVPSNDGKGIMFISHLGEVLPSGFLPIPSGNARRDSLVELYRESPLFKSLRDPIHLKGKCRQCPFNVICGGSRARAYAMTGDPLQAEPCCVFQPDSNSLSLRN
ncbi:MAG: radical SAM/SPASM domain-containing protein, partial [Chloroflexi bacterium]|nr:radical SAM/SPASM domain-containing protein [Chloroflexota bacterium]